MELAGSFDPDVARVLAADAVEKRDDGVGDAARIFELAHDGNDVRRVAEGGEGLADELAGREMSEVSESARERGRREGRT